MPSPVAAVASFTTNKGAMKVRAFFKPSKPKGQFHPTERRRYLMAQRQVWALGWVLVFAICSVALGRTEPVGVVTKVQGQVHVRRAKAKAWQAAHLNMPLYPGDWVRTGKNGRLVIWLQVGHPQTIEANKTVKATAERTPRDSLWREVWGAFTKRMHANLTEESLAAVAAARSAFVEALPERLPLILIPRNTKVANRKITFRWQEVLGAQGYRVTVGFFDEPSRVWEATVARPPLIYPDDAPPLQPGKVYVWRVEALGEGKGADSAWFMLVPSAETRDIQFALRNMEARSSDAATYALMAVGFLDSRGCYADALQLLQSAVKAAPDRKDLRLSLAYLYDAIGLKELAQREREQARDFIQQLRNLGWQPAAGN